jgi:hypothetical protein
MGLAEAQRLLAGLATDAELRDRFAADPVGVAAEFGLSPAEASSFAGLHQGQLDEFARSLIQKRFREVESLLPLTAGAVGPARFAALFRRHAGVHVPQGIKKHRDDAVAFADFLVREKVEPPWLAELARLEAAALLAHDPARRWLVIRLGHHPSDLARAAAEGGPAPRPRPTYVAWFRPSSGGRLRRVVLALPW